MSPSRQRPDRLERILRIDHEIRTGKFPTVEILANLFRVKTRTIYADRRYMLEKLGAPIAFHKIGRGWYYTDEAWQLPVIMLSHDELTALALAVKYLDAPFRRNIENVITKLGNYLPEYTTAELAPQFTISTSPAMDVPPELLMDLTQAIHRKEQVWIDYFTISRNQQTERIVQPYHLYAVDGHWYLIAHDLWRRDWRDFHLGRIKHWRLTGEHFVPNPQFSAETYINQGFLKEIGGKPYNVAIRFSAEEAPRIKERRWHKTQEPLEFLPDGSVILRFKASGWHEIKRWVMKHGAHAEMLQPEHLRAAIIDELADMVNLYPEVMNLISPK